MQNSKVSVLASLRSINVLNRRRVRSAVRMCCCPTHVYNPFRRNRQASMVPHPLSNRCIDANGQINGYYNSMTNKCQLTQCVEPKCYTDQRMHLERCYPIRLWKQVQGSFPITPETLNVGTGSVYTKCGYVFFSKRKNALVLVYNKLLLRWSEKMLRVA